VKIALPGLCRKLAVAILLAAVFFVGHAQAQITDAATTNYSTKVTTGLTYQLVLPAVGLPPATRRSLTIQNNQTSGTDLCYIIIGSTIGGVAMVAGTTTTSTAITINSISMTMAQASIVLNTASNASYTRFFPILPSDAVYGTCTTTGDSIYVDYQ
jgi:hypothetical protein